MIPKSPFNKGHGEASAPLTSMNGQVTNFAYPAGTLGDASRSLNPFAPKPPKSLQARGCEPRFPGSPGTPPRSLCVCVGGGGLTRVGVPRGRGAICREPQGRATQAAGRDSRPGRAGREPPSCADSTGPAAPWARAVPAADRPRPRASLPRPRHTHQPTRAEAPLKPRQPCPSRPAALQPPRTGPDRTGPRTEPVPSQSSACLPRPDRRLFSSASNRHRPPRAPRPAAPRPPAPERARERAHARPTRTRTLPSAGEAGRRELVERPCWRVPVGASPLARPRDAPARLPRCSQPGSAFEPLFFVSIYLFNGRTPRTRVAL